MGGWNGGSSTGSMNSSADCKGEGMGTKKSDKVGLLPPKEPVKGGLKKNSMPDREPPSPGGKKGDAGINANYTSFNRKSQGK